MIHLREVEVRPPPPDLSVAFPFAVPAIRALAGTTLRFPTAVTLFVGENGSGKSTLLEALAAAIGSITAGSVAASVDGSLDGIRPLADTLKPVWNRRTRRGFFLRSEDFFGYARKMQNVRTDLEAERRAILDAPDRTALSKGFAAMPYGREIADMERRHGPGLDARSHGEAFLALFRDRLVPDGLFLLDEPEAPMSPMRQLGLLALIRDAVKERDGQFIMATHSPILMALPDATIYSFGEGRVAPVAFADLEHVRFTRDFLNGPEAFLRHL